MKLSKTLPAIILTILMVMLACGTLYASKADTLLSQARSDVRTAQQCKTSGARDYRYKSAITKFNKLEKDFSGTPQAATALWQLADLYETARGSQKNLFLSYETLGRLVNIYSKSEEALSQNLEPREVRDVLTIVAAAKEKRVLVARMLDNKNKPQIQYKIMDFLVGATGRIGWLSYWLAIVLLTVIVKIIIHPLTKAQFKAMKEMQQVGPLLKEVQAKYKGDQKTIGEKTMEIYKEHKINPFASCLPLLIQMPILFGVYYTIKSYEFKFAEGTFLWIGQQFAHTFSFQVPFNPAQIVYVTGANLAEPDLILLLLYLVSMYFSTKLSNVDPSQAEQQKMMSVVMPIMFAFIFAGFPSAFLLYWLLFNVLQTYTQYRIMNAPSEPVPATSGVLPAKKKSKGK